MKLLKLHGTSNAHAIVDDDDFNALGGIKWYLQKKKGGNLYATSTADSKTITMHRVITGEPEGMVVDHINGNGLDNRKENLRVCTHKQNLWNQKKRTNKSGHTGVTLQKRGKWQASIGVHGSQKYLGVFETAELASSAYEKAASELFGEFKRRATA